MRNQLLRPFVVLLLTASLPLAGCGKKKAPAMPISGDSLDSRPAAVAIPPAPARDLGAGDARENPLDGDLAAATEHAYAAGLLGDVYFDFDEAALKPAARERLAKNAEFLRARTDFQVLIEGHCDDRGTSEYNLALGERRAQATRDYLVSLGVAAERLRGITYGEERPVCSEESESCWQLNRRAHFMLVGRASRG